MSLTYEQVAAAADELFRQSQKRPSIRTIRKALGSGSLTTIVNHLATWEAARGHSSTNGPPPVPEALRLSFDAVIPKLWKESLEASESHHQDEKQVLRSQLAAAAERGDELKSVLSDVETERDQLREQLGAALLENKRLDAELAGLAATHKTVTDTNAHLGEQLAESTRRLADAEQARADLQERVTREQGARLELERQLEESQGETRLRTSERDHARTNASEFEQRLADTTASLRRSEKAHADDRVQSDKLLSEAHSETARAENEAIMARRELEAARAAMNRTERALAEERERATALSQDVERSRAAERVALERESTALAREQAQIDRNQQLTAQVASLTTLLEQRFDALSRAVVTPPSPPDKPA